ncbi:MAG: tail fiber domain-containing protein [Kiritimatiellae bacterium]|nr:tail fiber domain-containing protein [Kiritimatiellia bacterium]
MDDSVTFRCLGGVRFLTGAGGANQMVSWTPGAGAWLFTSDRETKEGWAPVDKRALLERLADLPITEWNYKGYPQRHVGPTAQDFHAAFPFSNSDTMLNGLDLDGVSLAAIQGLYEVVKEENARLRGENEELRGRLSAIERKLGLARQ